VANKIAPSGKVTDKKSIVEVINYAFAAKSQDQSYPDRRKNPLDKNDVASKSRRHNSPELAKAP
jgi:hypothetical protein